MSHRLFAQLAFERALGNAAIEALATALNDKDHFDAESMWPKDPMFIGKTSADIEAVAAELGQIIEDRIKDVLDGPGIRNLERGPCVHQIGSASGRESVCQYMYSPVGGV